MHRSCAKATMMHPVLYYQRVPTTPEAPVQFTERDYRQIDLARAAYDYACRYRKPGAVVPPIPWSVNRADYIHQIMTQFQQDPRILLAHLTHADLAQYLADVEAGQFVLVPRRAAPVYRTHLAPVLPLVYPRIEVYGVDKPPVNRADLFPHTVEISKTTNFLQNLCLRPVEEVEPVFAHYVRVAAFLYFTDCQEWLSAPRSTVDTRYGNTVEPTPEFRRNPAVTGGLPWEFRLKTLLVFDPAPPGPDVAVNAAEEARLHGGFSLLRYMRRRGLITHAACAVGTRRLSLPAAGDFSRCARTNNGTDPMYWAPGRDDAWTDRLGNVYAHAAFQLAIFSMVYMSLLTHLIAWAHVRRLIDVPIWCAKRLEAALLAPHPFMPVVMDIVMDYLFTSVDITLPGISANTAADYPEPVYRRTITHLLYTILAEAPTPSALALCRQIGHLESLFLAYTTQFVPHNTLLRGALKSERFRQFAHAAAEGVDVHALSAPSIGRMLLHSNVCRLARAVLHFLAGFPPEETRGLDTDVCYTPPAIEESEKGLVAELYGESQLLPEWPAENREALQEQRRALVAEKRRLVPDLFRRSLPGNEAAAATAALYTLGVPADDEPVKSYMLAVLETALLRRGRRDKGPPEAVLQHVLPRFEVCMRPDICLFLEVYMRATNFRSVKPTELLKERARFDTAVYPSLHEAAVAVNAVPGAVNAVVSNHINMSSSPVGNNLFEVAAHVVRGGKVTVGECVSISPGTSRMLLALSGEGVQTMDSTITEVVSDFRLQPALFITSTTESAPATGGLDVDVLTYFKHSVQQHRDRDPNEFALLLPVNFSQLQVEMFLRLAVPDIVNMARNLGARPHFERLLSERMAAETYQAHGIAGQPPRRREYTCSIASYAPTVIDLMWFLGDQDATDAFDELLDQTTTLNAHVYHMCKMWVGILGRLLPMVEGTRVELEMGDTVARFVNLHDLALRMWAGPHYTDERIKNCVSALSAAKLDLRGSDADTMTVSAQDAQLAVYPSGTIAPAVGAFQWPRARAYELKGPAARSLSERVPRGVLRLPPGPVAPGDRVLLPVGAGAVLRANLSGLLHLEPPASAPVGGFGELPDEEAALRKAAAEHQTRQRAFLALMRVVKQDSREHIRNAFTARLQLAALVSHGVRVPHQLGVVEIPFIGRAADAIIGYVDALPRTLRVQLLRILLHNTAPGTYKPDAVVSNVLLTLHAMFRHAPHFMTVDTDDESVSEMRLRDVRARFDAAQLKARHMATGVVSEVVAPDEAAFICEVDMCCVPLNRPLLATLRGSERLGDAAARSLAAIDSLCTVAARPGGALIFPPSGVNDLDGGKIDDTIRVLLRTAQHIYCGRAAVEFEDAMATIKRLYTTQRAQWMTGERGDRPSVFSISNDMFKELYLHDISGRPILGHTALDRVRGTVPRYSSETYTYETWKILHRTQTVLQPVTLDPGIDTASALLDIGALLHFILVLLEYFVHPFDKQRGHGLLETIGATHAVIAHAKVAGVLEPSPRVIAHLVFNSVFDSWRVWTTSALMRDTLLGDYAYVALRNPAAGVADVSTSQARVNPAAHAHDFFHGGLDMASADTAAIVFLKTWHRTMLLSPYSLTEGGGAGFYIPPHKLDILCADLNVSNTGVIALMRQHGFATWRELAGVSQALAWDARAALATGSAPLASNDGQWVYAPLLALPPAAGPLSTFQFITAPPTDQGWDDDAVEEILTFDPDVWSGFEEYAVSVLDQLAPPSATKPLEHEIYAALRNAILLLDTTRFHFTVERRSEEHLLDIISQQSERTDAGAAAAIAVFYVAGLLHRTVARDGAAFTVDRVSRLVRSPAVLETLLEAAEQPGMDVHELYCIRHLYLAEELEGSKLHVVVTADWRVSFAASGAARQRDSARWIILYSVHGVFRIKCMVK